MVFTATMSLAAWTCGYFSKEQQPVSRWFTGCGMGWWLITSLTVPVFWPQPAAVLAFIAITFPLLDVVASWLSYGHLRYILYAYLPLVAGLLWVTFDDPLLDGGFVGWSLIIAMHLFLLWRGARQRPQWVHCGGVWIGTLLLAAIVQAFARQMNVATELRYCLPWLAAPGFFLLLLVFAKRVWPVSTHRKAYLVYGAIPISVLIAGSLVSSFRLPGVALFGVYIPILNVVDLSQLVALLALFLWGQELRRWISQRQKTIVVWLVSSLVFVWLNVVLLRGVAQSQAINYSFVDLWKCSYAQVGITLLWTVIALVVMVGAGRLQARSFWFAGTTLLVVVVGKLLLIDLKGDPMLRIVSFIVAGVLFLIASYLAPLPPKRRAITQKSSSGGLQL